MMYFLLILFFGSLLGIIFMIARKLSVLKSGPALSMGEDISADTILEELKHKTILGVKKYSHLGFLVILVLYVRASNYTLKKYQELKIRVNNKFGKNEKDGSTGKVEASIFLKMISEYKRQIRRIRRQIKEEEES